jgi:hypothetical protein
MSTAKTLDERLDDLVHDIKVIKKELIRDRMGRAGMVQEQTATWVNLGKKVSAQWDAVSAVDEIASQREKRW